MQLLQCFCLLQCSCFGVLGSCCVVPSEYAIARVYAIAVAMGSCCCILGGCCEVVTVIWVVVMQLLGRFDWLLCSCYDVLICCYTVTRV